jgi:hypothetical protein
MSLFGGVLIGSLAGVVTSAETVSRKSSLVTYMCISQAALTFIQTFECASVYGAYERSMLGFYIQSRSLHKRGVAIMNFFRFVTVSFIVSSCYYIVFYSFVDLPGEFFPDHFIIFLMTVLYIAAIGFCAFSFGLIIDPSLAIHLSMLMFSTMLFLSGFIAIPFGELPEILKTLHFMVPSFYLTTSTANILFQDYKMDCKELDHPAVCSGGEFILNQMDLPDHMAHASIAASGIFLCVTFLALAVDWHWLHLLYRDVIRRWSTSKSSGCEPARIDHETSVATVEEATI